MKKLNKRKKNKKKKIRKVTVTSAKKRWALRKKTFSPYPYILTISYYKTNVFFTVADMKGQTKLWTSTGRSGFKKKDKTTYMAIVRVTELFYKRLWQWGVREVVLKFKNVAKRSARFALRHSLRKIRKANRKVMRATHKMNRKYRQKKQVHKIKAYPRLRYMGFLWQFSVSFNGCRKKKQRRK